MKKWNERPFEIRNLFNPAFCGVLLLRAIKGYKEENGSGMPFSLALLVLPLCLHKDSREIILKHSRSYLLKTLAENPQMFVGFAERAKMLLPYSLEGLGYAMQLNSFKVTSEGFLNINDKGVRSKIDGTIESIECQKAARLVGKKFAQIGDRITVYTTLGVKP